MVIEFVGDVVGNYFGEVGDGIGDVFDCVEYVCGKVKYC